MILRDLHTLFAVPACNHSFFGKTLHLRLLLKLSRMTRIKELIQFFNFLAYGTYIFFIFHLFFEFIDTELFFEFFHLCMDL